MNYKRNSSAIRLVWSAAEDPYLGPNVTMHYEWTIVVRETENPSDELLFPWTKLEMGDIQRDDDLV